jgi:hypothetical protein
MVNSSKLNSPTCSKEGVGGESESSVQFKDKQDTLLMIVNGSSMWYTTSDDFFDYDAGNTITISKTNHKADFFVKELIVEIDRYVIEK